MGQDKVILDHSGRNFLNKACFFMESIWMLCYALILAGSGLRKRSLFDYIYNPKSFFDKLCSSEFANATTFSLTVRE